MSKLCNGLIFLLIFSSLCLQTQRVNAQDTLGESKSNQYWVHLGAGGSSSGYPATGLGASYRFGVSVLSMRFTYSEEMQILFPLTPNESEWDAGVLYGVSANSSHFLISASAGIGVVSGVRRGNHIGNDMFSQEYERHSYTIFGLPVEAQVFWITSSSWGFGVNVFANFNHEHSFVGGLLSVQFGVLR